MAIALAIIGAILAVFLVIVIHEFGHFLVAKMCGVKILRFSIGFGKSLYTHVSRGGTEYVLAILPLGGYVKMLDDREFHVSQTDSQRAYNRQPLYIRMAIVLAGPVTNFLLAVVAFWIIFSMGVTYIKPVVGQVRAQSVAEQAGIKPGDTIVAIDGRKVRQWQQVMVTFIERIGWVQPVYITTEKNGVAEQHQISLKQWRISGSQPDPLDSLGITPYQPAIPAIVDKIMAHSPAQRSGLQPGDQIVKVDDHPVSDWQTVADFIKQHPNQESALTISRNNQTKLVNVQLDSQTINRQRAGYLGVIVKIPPWPAQMIDSTHYSLITAWAPALQQSWELTKFNCIVLAKMFSGKISMQTLGGPITIFRSAGAASEAGLKVYLNFIGFISVTLAFINILPIPGLDGGHFLFQLIEGLIGRPISEKYQNLLLKLGIIVIILLVLQGTVNDIIRLFQ
ncbi:MAG: RIP metalloprotease RseP [Proteobacteria bacterium]|nr:RIP metalloprotease RseP [Pseudomonadota bacterium]